MDLRIVDARITYQVDTNRHTDEPRQMVEFDIERDDGTKEGSFKTPISSSLAQLLLREIRNSISGTDVDDFEFPGPTVLPTFSDPSKYFKQ